MKTYGVVRCDTCKKDITKEAQCYDRKRKAIFCRKCNLKIKS